jgi:hypothetical protein
VNQTLQVLWQSPKKCFDSYLQHFFLISHWHSPCFPTILGHLTSILTKMWQNRLEILATCYHSARQVLKL